MGPMLSLQLLQCAQQLADVTLGVRGVDLEADRFIALRDDRKRQADGEDPAFEEPCDHRSHPGGVTHD